MALLGANMASTVFTVSFTSIIKTLAKARYRNRAHFLIWCKISKIIVLSEVIFLLGEILPHNFDIATRVISNSLKVFLMKTSCTFESFWRFIGSIFLLPQSFLIVWLFWSFYMIMLCTSLTNVFQSIRFCF